MVDQLPSRDGDGESVRGDTHGRSALREGVRNSSFLVQNYEMSPESFRK